MTEQQRRSICANVARIIQAERKRRGLSMTALAVKAGLSQQMVSYVERGMRNPTLETLLRIAGALAGAGYFKCLEAGDEANAVGSRTARILSTLLDNSVKKKATLTGRFRFNK